MTQTSYPTADDALGSWTNPTWSVVDDESDSDSSDSGNVRTADSVCTLTIASLTDPQSSSLHVITVRAKYTTNNSRVGQIKAELLEGATVRATLALVDTTTSFAAYTYTLSSGEADAITNYSALKLKLTAHMKSTGSGTQINVQCSSAKLTVPDAPSGVNGTASVTLANLSPSAAGTIDIAGAASKTLANLTPAAAGTIAINGAAASTLGILTGQAAGGVAVSAGGAVTLGALSGQATGAVGSTPVSGAGAVTLAGVTPSAVGNVALVGNGTITLAGVTGSAAGTVSLSGVGAVTLANLSGSAEVFLGTPPNTGQAAVTLAGLTPSAVGGVDIAGAGASTLANLSGSANSAVSIFGSGAVSLAGIAATAMGMLPIVGSGSGQLDDLAALAGGLVAIEGSGAATISISGAGEGGTGTYGSGAVHLAGIVAEASGTAAFVEVYTPLTVGERDFTLHVTRRSFELHLELRE